MTGFVEDSLPLPERMLSGRDALLGRVIAAETERWPHTSTENPISGLVRIVIAQQVSTRLACRLADRVRSAYPSLGLGEFAVIPDVARLREFGLPEGRARCCVEIVRNSESILENVRAGTTWEEALSGIKGIGPWTICVFRIMVLRDADVIPSGDVGLERAVAQLYGRRSNLERLSNRWKPFRSVACWYLWRTLGNDQLG
jgi:DNA-3-methyladenine glycosylase II